MSNEQSGVDAPSLPDDVIEAIREYGDARSDPATAAGSTAKMGAANLAARRWGASLAARPAHQAVPDGWKLVPLIATNAMSFAGSQAQEHACDDVYPEQAEKTYAAMLAAAPAAPQAEPQQWIDDPHDIEQGSMLNPEWLKLQGLTANQAFEADRAARAAPHRLRRGQSHWRGIAQAAAASGLSGESFATAARTGTRPA